MSAFARTQSDGTWTSGYITLVSDWVDLDKKIFKSVNGDQGGCWAPIYPIILDGSGVTFTGPSVIAYGGALVLTGSTAGLLIDDDSWPLLGATHVGRKRTIVTSCIGRQSMPPFHWITNTTDGSIRSIACTLNVEGINLVQPSFTLPLRVHDGARLISVTVSFRVPVVRKVPPVVTPRIRVVRVDSEGNIETLQSVGSGADVDGLGGTDVNGFIPFTMPTTGPAWYNDGQAQTFTVGCDQNNVVDVSLYNYYVELIEECGSIELTSPTQCDGFLVREQKQTVTATLIDTWPWPGDTKRVLLFNTDVDFSDNIRTSSTTSSPYHSWPYADDFDSAEDFTPWFLVAAEDTREVWECYLPVENKTFRIRTLQFSDPPDADGLYIDGSLKTKFRKRTANGNIYHAVSCNFDSIVDMRPQ